jgi:hypothetical protein
MKTLITKQHRYKYRLQILWPAILKNRGVNVLKNRADLVEQMNLFRVKIQNVCKVVCKGLWEMDIAHDLKGVTLWFSTGADCYYLILNQPEFKWIINENIGVVNHFTSELKNYKLIYTSLGISVEELS